MRAFARVRSLLVVVWVPWRVCLRCGGPRVAPAVPLRCLRVILVCLSCVQDEFDADPFDAAIEPAAPAPAAAGSGSARAQRHFGQLRAHVRFAMRAFQGMVSRVEGTDQVGTGCPRSMCTALACTCPPTPVPVS